MCEQGLGMRPSWMRLSACSRESQQALAALATLSVSLLAVHAAALQGTGQSQTAWNALLQALIAPWP